MQRRDDRNDRGPFEKIGEGVGGLAGRAAGQATDMAMNAAGAVFGSAMEALGGWWATDSARDASRSFEGRDGTCRRHFESSAGTGASRSYESARPLYQFGHVAGQNPDYQGRSFDEVEPDLQRAWGREQSSTFGEWPEVRGYVGFGYGSEGG